MNEAGLVANILYLAEAEYHARGRRRHAAHAADLGLGAIHARQLRHHRRGRRGACAAEAFRVVPIVAPTGEPGTVHLSISDASGDSAIFEFIDGKLVIHHGREYQMMTNSPTYDQQLGLAAYWKTIGGSVMLPGTNRASDRFARMSYYINEATQTADPRRAVATVFSVMRNVSVPHRDQDPRPAQHRRHAVADGRRPEEPGLLLPGHQRPGILWTNLDRLDFSEGSGAAQAATRRQPRSRAATRRRTSSRPSSSSSSRRTPRNRRAAVPSGGRPDRPPVRRPHPAMGGL